MTTENKATEPRRDTELTAPPERPHDTTGASDADPVRRELRADSGKYVSLAEFPATAQSLIDSAAANGAPDFVLITLRGPLG